MANNGFEVAKTHALKDSITYNEGAVVSKVITRNKNGNITLFAFDKGQFLSEHTAPFDAVVQLIEGNAKIRIDGIENLVHEGQIIVMPAKIPHAVEASEKFKMLLTMIKD
jgi:quercetin dioxygenase-like cupin family protein